MLVSTGWSGVTYILGPVQGLEGPAASRSHTYWITDAPNLSLSYPWWSQAPQGDANNWRCLLAPWCALWSTIGNFPQMLAHSQVCKQYDCCLEVVSYRCFEVSWMTPHGRWYNLQCVPPSKHQHTKETLGPSGIDIVQKWSENVFQNIIRWGRNLVLPLRIQGRRAGYSEGLEGWHIAICHPQWW